MMRCIVLRFLGAPLQYIDEVRTVKPLLPSNPYLTSQAKFWADFVDNKIHGLGRKTWTTKGDEQEAAKKEYIDCIKLLEVELGDKPSFGGETLGFVLLLQLYDQD
ncbi:putative glutathione transferase [Rosa chinensis]|uniref:Glutathione S-transferase n=1 Tax=Rosa chinensis TaxID=74649 RepID=A0A2P6QE16_ROSCH|nr:putative glutathione transferase [Rosa chinensis]